MPLIGALKLVALIMLAEVVSQLDYRRKGRPHLDLEALEVAAAGEAPRQWRARRCARRGATAGVDIGYRWRRLGVTRTTWFGADAVIRVL